MIVTSSCDKVKRVYFTDQKLTVDAAGKNGK